MLSVVGRRSSVVGRRSSVVGRRSSVVGRRSSVVSRRSSVVGRQSSVISNQQSASYCGARSFINKKLSQAVIPGRHLVGLESPTYSNGSFKGVPVWRQKYASFIIMKLLSIESGGHSWPPSYRAGKPDLLQRQFQRSNQ
jgi:hypothetical protein